MINVVLLCKVCKLKTKNFKSHVSTYCMKQESPPAWTQEAYWPQPIKYSICYPVQGGYPIPAGGYLRWGTPWPGQMGVLEGVPLGPGWGTPLSDLAGVPPCQTWLGYPPAPGEDRLKTLPSLVLRTWSVIIVIPSIILRTGLSAFRAHLNVLSTPTIEQSNSVASSPIM